MMVNTSEANRSSFRVHGVRYQSRDVSRAVAFYTRELGFDLKHQRGEAFAAVSCGGIDLLLSRVGSSGAHPLPNGEQQEPGGWNRLVLAVTDLATVITSLKTRGVRFRNEMVAGPGGKADADTRSPTAIPSSYSNQPPRR